MITKKVVLIAIAIIACLLGIIAFLSNRLSSVKEERDIQRKNVSTLLLSVESYKTKDSLQAATVGQLNLTLDQYKKYRSEDVKIIESLKVDNKRLDGIITAKTESYYKNTTALRDSIRILKEKGSDSIIIDTIKTASFSDEWHSINIYLEKDSLLYDLKTRESIIVINHVVPKRFLGFLWKYGVKEIKTDVVSKNPYTDSVFVESIIIK